MAVCFLAFSMSLLAIIAALLGFGLQRRKIYQLDSFELVIKIHFSSTINPSAKDMVAKKIQQNRGRYQAVVQPIIHHCKDLTSNQVAVGSVDVAGNTITIYGNILRLPSVSAGVGLEKTRSISSLEKNATTSYDVKNDKLCQAVLLQGFKLEKELKGYMQSGNPKVTIKGSYFKILNVPQQEEERKDEKEAEVEIENIQSISGENIGSPSLHSVDSTERGP